jgi:hypothetical protein
MSDDTDLEGMMQGALLATRLFTLLPKNGPAAMQEFVSYVPAELWEMAVECVNLWAEHRSEPIVVSMSLDQFMKTEF